MSKSNSNGRPAGELFDEGPPRDGQMEQQTVGSVMLDPTQLDNVSPLQRSDFHDDRNGRLWEHLQNLPREVARDPTLLVRWLTGVADLESCGGPAYIGETMQSVAVASNAKLYAAAVRECSQRRRLWHTGWELLRGASDPTIPTPDVLAIAEQAADGQAAGSGGVDFAPMTLGELMECDVGVEYLIPGCMVAAQPMLLAGPVKSLKTSLLLDLSLALATGGHFLGYFAVTRPANVCVMTGESGLATVKETYQRIATAARVDPATITNLTISDKIPQLADPTHLLAIRKLIETHKLEVLAIDPAYLALDGTDAANVMIFGQQLRGVSELCQEAGTALVLCHHTRKASGFDFAPIGLTDAAWAGFAEHCRQWVLVNPRERFDAETGSHRLWLTLGGSAGHCGCYALDVYQGHTNDAGGRVWETSITTPDDARRQAEEGKAATKTARQQEALDADRRELVNAAVKAGGPETKKGLRDRVSYGHRRFDMAFASLTSDGTLEPAKVTRDNHHTYDGWKVCDDPE